ncbi:hypothetical protein C0993_009645 [Termitomyces sp. T159_Od127]|nr:hypothetical protein C0993_009645 [Termitomyces sp. T159_Od127]
MRPTSHGSPHVPFLPMPPPRIKYPSKNDEHKFAFFANSVDQQIEADRAELEREITDDESYTFRYEKLNSLIEQAAVDMFGCNKPYLSLDKKVTSPTIREIVTRICHIGGTISIVKGHPGVHSFGSQRAFESMWLTFNFQIPRPMCTFAEYLVSTRRAYYRNLYATKKAEIWEHARCYDLGWMSGVLNGGLSKKLLGGSSAFVSLPTALQSTINLGVIETSPGNIAEATRQYFANLYKRSPPPNKPKPWLTSPAVVEVWKQVIEDPFVWPIAATPDEFRAMLRKENQRPSPGPDGWEKWCVKSLYD